MSFPLEWNSNSLKHPRLFITNLCALLSNRHESESIFLLRVVFLAFVSCLWMAVETRQLCLGVHHLHEEQKVLHRDIKPNNVFLMESKKIVQLGDFGLAKVIGGSDKQVKAEVCPPPAPPHPRRETYDARTRD